MQATALIAEDEPLLAAHLQSELASLWPQLTIAALVGDGQSAVDKALALAPQVLFFDVRMPGLTGLEAAQAVVEDWPAEHGALPLIVFVTAYDQYALQAFEAQAVDYLVKPVDRTRLADCVVRLQRRLADRAAASAGAPGLPDAAALEATLAPLRALFAEAGMGAALAAAAQPNHSATAPLAVIQAQVGAVVQLVPVDEVVYFEAADKYVRVITATREHLIRMSLKELLPQLDAARFWQVHRGTVVNVRSIASARRDESGKVFLKLREREETLTASRLYAHLFKGM